MLCVIHEDTTVSLFSDFLVCDDAGDITGLPGQPEGIEKSAVAEAHGLAVVKEQVGKVVGIGKDIIF